MNTRANMEDGVGLFSWGRQGEQYRKGESRTASFSKLLDSKLLDWFSGMV